MLGQVPGNKTILRNNREDEQNPDQVKLVGIVWLLFGFQNLNKIPALSINNNGVFHKALKLKIPENFEAFFLIEFEYEIATNNVLLLPILSFHFHVDTIPRKFLLVIRKNQFQGYSFRKVNQ
jgi:hypothetical protein